MKIFFICIYLIQNASLFAEHKTWTDENRREESDQIHYWRARISEVAAWGKTEKLEELSIGLKCINYRSKMDGHTPEIDGLHNQIQREVTTISGHTKYFTDKIDAAKKLNEERISTIELTPGWEKQPEDSEIYLVNARKWFELWGGYSQALSENIGMLGLIPSTESVRALGIYLLASEDPNIKYPPPTGSYEAAGKLTDLIADGPMQTWLGSYSDITKWQKWFDEVQAGKRTFRFVGSDVEYTLDGPADTKTLERIRNKDSSGQRSSGRREPADTTKVPNETNKRDPFFYGVILAAAMLCVASIAFFLKRRSII
ncbi:MAG: hypothetical protein H8M99_12080 [Gloeobacteraceae cyanobacterium ES-bin-144]|nr:hypothetical protein [Verrucomicrobiales bacterium]